MAYIFLTLKDLFPPRHYILYIDVHVYSTSIVVG